MEDKIFYEVQGDIPVKSCVDGKKVVSQMDKLLASANKVIEYLNKDNLTK